MSKSSEKPKKQQKQKPQKTLKKHHSASARPRSSVQARFSRSTSRRPGSSMDDYGVVAEELSQLAEKMRGVEERLAEVERVNARLEEAALTTARALGEAHVTGRRCTTPCAVRTESTEGSRPSATTMRLGRVAAPHRLRVVTPGGAAAALAFSLRFRELASGAVVPVDQRQLPPSAAALTPSSAGSEPYPRGEQS